MRVLFVCHGNICRSPMAEFILKALVRSRGQEGAWHIESAAVSTEEIGNPIYPPAKRCLSQHGVPFDKEKRARQVTRADYDRFDRIICMDAWNLRLASAGTSRTRGIRGISKQPSKISWKVVKRCLCKGTGYWKQYPSPSLVITFSA